MSGQGLQWAQPAFKGRPRTRLFRNRKREYGYVVRIRELTPMRAICAEIIARLSALAVMLAGPFVLAAHEIQAPLAYLAVFIGPAVLIHVWIWLWELMLRKEVILRYDPRFLRRQGLVPWRPFDSSAISGFALREHPKAPYEAADDEFLRQKAAMRRKTVRIKPFYQNSYNLVVGYYGEDRVLMPIYRKERAERIAMRLQAIHETLRANVAGTEDPYAPEARWRETAGDL